MTTQPNPIAIELKAMADRLRELFPEVDNVNLEVYRDWQHVAFHQCGDYGEATELFRRLDIGERNKRIPDPEAKDSWSVIEGEVDGVKVTAFCTGLPPSCRIETETRRIPKTQTVDTGEFIEVQERVVKCGQTVEAT